MLRRSKFTRRHHDVLAGLLVGKSDKDIARDLGLSLSTVKAYVKSLFLELNVKTRTEAVALVLRAALAQPCPRCGFIDDGSTTDTLGAIGAGAYAGASKR